MGMFDTVVNNGFKLKVPREVSSFLKANNSEIPNEFQTKDLHNCLTTFKLFPNGQLLESGIKPTGRKIPYKNPFEGWQDNRSFLERMFFKIKFAKKDNDNLIDETIEIFEKSKLTAIFDIYSYSEIGGRFLTLEYKIETKNGKVKSAKLLKWEIESEENAKIRITADNEWKESVDRSIAKSKELRATWYYPLLKEIYNPFIFFTSLLVQKSCGWLVKQSYKWRRV